MRRLAFVVSGTAWAVALALPAAVYRLSLQPFALALAMGSGAAIVAITLAAFSQSSVASRIVLLVLWYAYLSS